METEEMASVLTKFFLIWTQDENNPRDIPSFPQRISRIRDTYFASFIEILANLSQKQTLVGILAIIRNVIKEGATTIENSGLAAVSGKVTRHASKLIIVYSIISLTISFIKDYTLRQNRNLNIYFTDKLQKIISNLTSYNHKLLSEEHSQALKAISERNDHTDVMKSYYNLTQKTLFVAVDAYCYIMLLPLPILSALLVAAFVTNLLTQGPTAEQNKVSNSIRKFRNVVHNLLDNYKSACDKTLTALEINIQIRSMVRSLDALKITLDESPATYMPFDESVYRHAKTTLEQAIFPADIYAVNANLNSLIDLYEAVENADTAEIRQDLLTNFSIDALGTCSEKIKNDYNQALVMLNSPNISNNEIKKKMRDLLTVINNDPNMLLRHQALSAMKDAYNDISHYAANTLGYHEKGQGVLSDYIVNSLMRVLVTCGTLYFCANITLSTTAGFVWMLTTCQITDQAFKDFSDYVKQAAIYTKYKAKWNQTFGQAINKADPNLIDELERSISGNYFESRLQRVLLYLVTILCAFGLSNITLPIPFNIFNIVSVVSINQVIALIIVSCLTYQYFIAADSTHANHASSTPLATIIFMTALVAACYYAFTLYNLYSISTFIADPLLSLGLFTGCVSVYIFDQHVFQTMAFSLDILLTTISQLTLVGLHKAAYMPNTIAKETAKLPQKAHVGIGKIASSIGHMSRNIAHALPFIM